MQVPLNKMIKISPLEQRRPGRKESKGSLVTEIALRWNAYREDKFALNMEVCIAVVGKNSLKNAKLDLAWVLWRSSSLCRSSSLFWKQNMGMKACTFIGIHKVIPTWIHCIIG